ncbi:MAG: hypothetical protein ACRC10_01415 [Thermoguttaceae bacterium]
MTIFDTFCLDEPLLESIQTALDEHEKELKFLLLALQIGGVGPWEQYDVADVYLTSTWCRVFEQKDGESFDLAKYYALIDSPIDQARVKAAREKLVLQPIGTKWNDTFTLAGKPVRSFALVSESTTIIGVDVIG